MSKGFKNDPAWAKAKTLCRLNQDDIAKAQQLGLKPKSLLKNIPSPQQKWKLPVKQWIHELYAKKFGGELSAKSAKLPAPPKRSRAARDKSDRAFAYAPEPWDDDDEELFELSEESFPTVPLEEVAQFYFSDDPHWRTHRLARRQMNLRWAAATLAITLRDIAAVDTIALFGSVARSLLEGPGDELWEDPPPRTLCRDLDLALWVTSHDDAVLRAIVGAVNQTLASLAETEFLKLGWEQLDLHLLEAEAGHFLGHLRAADDGTTPLLDTTNRLKLDLNMANEFECVFLFEREMPEPDAPANDDVPF